MAFSLLQKILKGSDSGAIEDILLDPQSGLLLYPDADGNLPTPTAAMYKKRVGFDHAGAYRTIERELDPAHEKLVTFTGYNDPNYLGPWRSQLDIPDHATQPNGRFYYNTRSHTFQRKSGNSWLYYIPDGWQKHVSGINAAEAAATADDELFEWGGVVYIVSNFVDAADEHYTYFYSSPVAQQHVLEHLSALPAATAADYQTIIALGAHTTHGLYFKRYGTSDTLILRADHITGAFAQQFNRIGFNRLDRRH